MTSAESFSYSASPLISARMAGTSLAVARAMRTLLAGEWPVMPASLRQGQRPLHESEAGHHVERVPGTAPPRRLVRVRAGLGDQRAVRAPARLDAELRDPVRRMRPGAKTDLVLGGRGRDRLLHELRA